MKRTPLKKKSKQPISKIQREIWEHCRRIKNKPVVDCYTCSAKNLQGSNKQLGHVPWPKSVLGAYQKYSLDLLEWQCFACNIHRGGAGAEAYERMLREKGVDKMAKLKQDRQITVKAMDHYLLLLDEYAKIL